MGNFKINFDNIVNVLMEGTPVDKPSWDLLVIKDEAAINDHLKMHAGIYAYYNELLSNAKTVLARLKRDYDIWRKQAYYVISKDLKSNAESKRQVTIGDIEGTLETEQACVIKEWLDKLDSAEDDVNTLDNFVKALGQKKEPMCELARNSRKFSPDGMRIYDNNIDTNDAYDEAIGGDDIGKE